MSQSVNLVCSSKFCVLIIEMFFNVIIIVWLIGGDLFLFIYSFTTVYQASDTHKALCQRK